MDIRIITNEDQAKILTEEPIKFSWGWFYPASSKAGIGLRMILENNNLVCLNDRVSRMGKDENMDTEVIRKFNQIKLSSLLHSFMKQNAITSKSEVRILGEFDGYKMLATPNGSYGYVYVSFWTE